MTRAGARRLAVGWRAVPAALAADLGMLLLALLALLSPFVAAAAHGPGDEHLEAGRLLYQEGRRVDGSLLRARGAAGFELEGPAAACAGCHRRSGLGGREGAIVVPAVAGSLLFAPAVPVRPHRPGREAVPVLPLRHEARPAYDGPLLARALREGVDSQGRALATLMPRYALTADDEQALAAYLRSLDADAAPGWSNGVLHLATVVTPDADPARADVVVRALQAWARSGALGGLAIDLQVWRLEGEESGWPAQLESLHRREPPYALLSGAGASRWRAVRDHCERHALPCLFPIVDDAPDDSADEYSLYFSRGVLLEARLLASLLQQRADAPRIVQWLDARDTAAGRSAARHLEQALGPVREVLTRPIDVDDPPWRELRPDDLLVAWLPAPALQRVAAGRTEGAGLPLVLSARLAQPSSTSLPKAWRRDAAWISAQSDTARLLGKGAIGLLPWLQRLQLPRIDDALLSEVYAATYFFGDALSRLQGHRSREALIEALESASYARPAGAAFVSLSLGPGQREAAKAGHLLRYAADGQTLVAVGPRVRP